MGDINGDGDLDLVARNEGQANRLYQRRLYHTAQGQAESLRVDTETNPITAISLTPAADLPPNTNVTYWVSNNGGARWYQARPGILFTFPTTGTDLRWRADRHSLSLTLTPRITSIVLAKSESAQQCGVVDAGGPYSIGVTNPLTLSVATAGTLDCVNVTYFPTSHPTATLGIETGAYWTFDGLDTLGDPATGFTVTLTLPATFAPDADDKVCRYVGPGAVGDCAAGGFDSHTVWRDGITGFSDWAVGNDVGPTSVALQSLSANPVTPVGAGLLALLGGVIVVWRRKRQA